MLNSPSQLSCQGQSLGRWMTSCRADLARRSGTAISCRRMVAVVVLAWNTEAMVPAARVTLKANAGSASHAALAANCPQEACARAPPSKSAMTCSMIACSRWVFSASSMVSGESVNNPVVAVGREQLALAVGDRLGAQAFDPAHDQPGADVVGFAPGGERGEGDLDYFGIRDQALCVFVPDRVRVVDRNPCRLLDARDRFNDSTVQPGGDREPGPIASGRGYATSSHSCPAPGAGPAWAATKPSKRRSVRR